MSVEKRGDRYRARYRGPDGRERNKSFRRKLDAQRWLAEQKTRISRGEWVDPAALRINFGVVAQEWFGTILHLKPRTRDGYRRLLDRRILPRWERVPMGKLAGLVPDWITELGASNLSPTDIRQTVYVFSAVCQYGIRTGRLLANPVSGVKLPRPKPSRDRVFLSHAEVGKLAAEAGSYGTLVRLLAYTGLRWGEVIALRVRDVDLARRRLDVRRAFADLAGKLVEGTPKSHQSRTVPLPPSLCEELLHLVDGRGRDALVFTSPRGGPLRLTNFRRSVWHPAVRAAGLDGLTIHGMRHTAASLYISAGTPPKVVQQILGHASITITMDLYGHLYADEMDTWAARLDKTAREFDVWPEGGQNGGSDGDDEETSGGAGL
ncbi:site-specific integrase [Actinopolymorpha sp. B11F2]|uniref:tyrosine-type recombinase/integrase n=1 Tax=Actinopolymorpha sp. B11F2 TaxID=3160862 RepID=UPI0032E412C9